MFPTLSLSIHFSSALPASYSVCVELESHTARAIISNATIYGCIQMFVQFLHKCWSASYTMGFEPKNQSILVRSCWAKTIYCNDCICVCTLFWVENKDLSRHIICALHIGERHNFSPPLFLFFLSLSLHWCRPSVQWESKNILCAWLRFMLHVFV